MESKDLKKLLGDIAKENDFTSAFGGWYKESDKCIFVLSLQKSNYGDFFYLNLKIFIQGIFSKNYTITKDLMKNNLGSVSLRSPKEYDKYFNFKIDIDDNTRKKGLQELFINYISPFAEKALTIGGIKELAEEQRIMLLPAVQLEIEKIE